jgi:hypothetical protein
MTMNRFVKHVFRKMITKSSVRPRTAHRAHLTLEGLEDRFVPALLAPSLPYAVPVSDGIVSGHGALSTHMRTGNDQIFLNTKWPASPVDSLLASKTVVAAMTPLLPTGGGGGGGTPQAGYQYVWNLQSLPGAVAGQSYSTTISATAEWTVNGQVRRTFLLNAYTLGSGALPAGLSLSSSGVLSGLTTQAGTCSIAVIATGTDPVSHITVTTARAYGLSVNPGAASSFRLTSSTTATGTGVPFSITITAIDSYGNPAAYTGPVTLNSSNSLVVATTNLTLNNGQGTFSVTANSAGTAMLSVAAGSLQSNTVSLTAYLPLALSTAPLPVDTAGWSYSVPIQASGGSGHYNFALASGSLPAGLQLNSAGVLSGTTVTAGTFNFTIVVTDSVVANATARGSYRLFVNPAAASSLTLTTTTVVTNTGNSFNVTITARDAYGNTAAFNGSVALNSSNSQVISSRSVALSNGQGTVSLTALHSGTVTLSATVGSLQSNSATIQVSPTQWVFHVTFWAGDSPNPSDAGLEQTANYQVWALSFPQADGQANNDAQADFANIWYPYVVNSTSYDYAGYYITGYEALN